MTWTFLLLVAALVAFVLSTFDVPHIGRIQWAPLGFVFVTIWLLLSRYMSSGS